MTSHFKNIVKLAGTGAVIFGIGFATLVQNPEQPTEVAEVTADITLFSGNDGTEYTRAMASLGLEPRPYDLNGNVMYFATGYADGKSPEEVMQIVQKELVRYGINSKDYSDITPMHAHLKAQKWTEDSGTEGFEGIQDISAAYLKGEVMPIEKRPGYIAMAGVNPQKSYEKIIEDYQEHKHLGLNEQLGAYRFIDATSEPEFNRTMVTAVWSADDFSAAKLENKTFIQAPPDPNVPACMGCERDFRMKSLATNEPFSANKFTTQTDLDTTYNFYKRAMEARGWRESGFQAKLNKVAEVLPEARIAGRTLNMEQGDRAMNIILIPDEQGKVTVYATEEGEGAQKGLYQMDLPR
jgi:hypothetical protein